ncbi:MAG: hypothetical protein ACI8WP_001629 [Flavobacteriaceae bacterium]|jgi:hypothetical protein
MGISFLIIRKLFRNPLDTNQKTMMISDQKVARIVGVLLLIIFALGVTMYQVLQGPTLFIDEYLTETSAQSSQVIGSTLLGILVGSLSIIIAIILLPIFKKHSERFGYLYLAFTIINFAAIALDNIAVLAMLEVSREYVKDASINLDHLRTMGTVFHGIHRWTHYLSLLTSCLPVFVLFFTLYQTKLIPRLLSGFGMIAAFMMLVQMVFSMFDNGISSNLLLPIAIIQLIFPIWLLIKGFNNPDLSGE